MQFPIKYFVLLLIAVSVCSCEKAIDLKLKDTTPQYVVEGVLTNQSGGCKVTLSQTKNFTADNSVVGIDGAQVTITDDNATYPLIAAGSGVYQNSALTGAYGHIYKLNVLVAGKIFTSTCAMPAAVALDSIYLVKSSFGDNKDGTTRKFVTVKYHDPAADKN